MFQTSPYSDPPVVLTPKQANIYVWGWQKKARFRDAVCGRRFGKTFLGKAEIRRAVRLAAEWGVTVEDEIWYGAPTFKQAKRVFWRRLKQAIPASWRASKPNETECSITTKAGHVVRIVGLDAYDNLRGSGLFFALVDEWADCPYEAWEEVLRPMLSTCRYTVNGEQRIGGHALRIGTPKGFNHCYDSYLDGQGKEPDHKSWPGTPAGTCAGPSCAAHVPAGVPGQLRELPRRHLLLLRPSEESYRRHGQARRRAAHRHGLQRWQDGRGGVRDPGWPAARLG